MALNINIGGQVLLTMKQVEEWRSERDQITARLADLNRKLEAAAVFFPEPTKQAPAAVAAGVLSLSDAIEVVLDLSKVAMTPRDIRDAVITHGFESMLGSENYLYTAIKRLADRGVIAKTEYGYVSASKGSSKEETPSHSAGGLFSPDTPMGGAGGTAPEAGGT